MTGTLPEEYRKLGYASSNDMIRYDARWGDGEYETAALHILNAGRTRIRMGQMMFDAGELARAAEDWLSAAACFYLAPDLDQLKAAFARVQELDRAGHIPANRGDLRAAIKEREGEIRTLEEKLTRFKQDYARTHGTAGTTGHGELTFLLGQIRELPGYPDLHALIVLCATRLGQLPLAFEHLEWAEKFAPGNHLLGAMRVRLLIASGQPERGVHMGRELLQAHPEMDQLRLLLAQTIAFPAGGGRGDWDGAIRLLRPLLENTAGDPSLRLRVLALATAICLLLRNEGEYHSLLDSFNRLAHGLRAPAEQEVISGLRRVLPQVFPQPGANGAAFSGSQPPLNEPDYSTLRRVFEELNPLTAGAAA